MALPNSKKRKIFDGRYEVIEIVGRGSDSVVYHARHIGPSAQEVALKVLINSKSRDSLTARLRKEALTLVSCRHKYVVRLDDFHSVDDLCYLSMEYAIGGDLRKFAAAQGGRIHPADGARFLHQVLEALDFVHATGVVHRDMKPDNILVAENSEIRLADFGLALLPGDDVSLEDLKAGVGSFAYLPPESLEGVRYDSRSDLYALGLCFYELLSGQHPFESLPIAEQLVRRTDGALPPLHEVDPLIPVALSQVISNLMKFDPSERYQTALEAITALNGAEGSALEHKLAANSDPSNFDIADDGLPLGSNAGAANEDSSFFDDLFGDDIFGDEELVEPYDETSDATPVDFAVNPQVFDDSSSSDSSIHLLDEGSDSVESQLAPNDQTESQLNTLNSGSAHPHVEPEAAAMTVEEENAPEDTAAPELSTSEAMYGAPSDENEDGPSRSERPHQPTEQIDLERIKAIIDKDTKHRAEAASRRKNAERQRAISQAVRDIQDADKADDLGGEDSTDSQPYHLRKKSVNAQGTARKIPLERFTLDGLKNLGISDIRSLLERLPTPLRPAAVGLGAALATVLIVSLARLLPFWGGLDGNAEQVEIGTSAGGDVGIVGTASNSDEATAGTAFPNLSEGTFVGHIDNLLPNTRAPLTLISQPKTKQVVVIVGIAGWTPVTVSTEVEDGSPMGTLKIRSNGLILEITGEGSSDKINGTFTNAITRQKGEWLVAKLS